jgi:hypothetical protein
MRRRALHLASLLLLLSSLGAAEGTALRCNALSAGGRYVSMILAQRAAASIAAEPLARNTASYKIGTFALPPAGRATQAAVWTMRPPAAQSLALQAATSSLI